MIRLSSKSVVIFASYNFETRDLRAVFSMLDMLTYQFYLLSKPNSPGFVNDNYWNVYVQILCKSTAFLAIYPHLSVNIIK